MRAAPFLLSALALAAIAVGIALWLQEPPAGPSPGVERSVRQSSDPRLGSPAQEEGALFPMALPDPFARLGEGAREGLGEARDRLSAAPQELRGRVVDGEGRPVAGARVFLGPRPRPAFPPLDLVSAGAPGAGARQPLRTAADGTFRGPDVPGGALGLAVRAEGFAPLRAEPAHPGPGGDLGDLVLERGVVLEGRVVDEHGRPLPGVEVHVLPEARGPRMAILWIGEGTRMGETDEEGAFRVEELAAGPYSLRFQHPSHPDQLLEGVTERPGMHVRGLLVQLERGFEVTGWVRGLGERDPSSLVVRARERQVRPGAMTRDLFARPRSAAIAPDGAFVLGGLREGSTHDLAVVEADAGPFGGERSTPVSVTPPERGVELALRGDASLLMRVVDARTGQPIEALRVEAGARRRAPLRDEDGRSIERYPEGRVRYEPLDPGPANRVSVRVSAEGYEAFERESLAVRPGQELDLGVVALEPAPLLEVRVTSADGAPVPGALVRLAEQSEDDSVLRAMESLGEGTAFFAPRGAGEARSARTDSNGVARVTALAGRSCTLSVTHPEHVAYRGEAFLVPTLPEEPLAVILQRGGTLLVRVLDAAGDPVEGVNVQHRPPDEGSAGLPRVIGRPRQSDRNGSVVFERLAPGRHGFRVDEGRGGFAAGITMRWNESGRIEGQPAADFTEIVVDEGTRSELVLTAPRRGALSGRLREGGRPLAGATLALDQETGDDPRARAMRSFGGGVQARSGGDGLYRFESLAAGEYILTVDHPSRAMPFEVAVSIEPPSSELDIDLPLTTISGLVLDEDGRAVAGALVRVVPPEGGARSVPFSSSIMVAPSGRGGGFSVSGPRGGSEARTDARGRYELRGVQADQDLVVHAEGEGDWQPARSKPLRLRLDENRRDVDVVLTRGGALSVQVLHADGSPATQVFLSADFAEKTEDRPDSRRELVREPGSVRLGGLRPGTWRLTARSLPGPGGLGARAGGAGGGEPVEVEVRAGEELPVVVRVP